MEENNNTQNNTENSTQEKKPKRTRKAKNNSVPKIINIRRCIACGAHRPKTEMLAIVRPPRKNGIKCMELKIQDGALPKIGRGTYVCKSVACVLKAKKYKRFERSFTQPMAPGTYEQLEEMARESEQKYEAVRAEIAKLNNNVELFINKLVEEGKFEELDRLGYYQYLASKERAKIKARQAEEARAEMLEFSKKYYAMLERESKKSKNNNSESNSEQNTEQVKE